MDYSSRTTNTMRNLIFNLSGRLLTIFFSFAGRTVFINTLGAEYLGVSGLFSNILSLLSLAELGIGSAITYSMYKPLAERDETKIKALMQFYATAYQIIACSVALLGLAILPFLDKILTEKPDIPNLLLIYLMFVLNSVISYLFAYKSAIITADQKQYITVIYSNIFSILQNIMQIIVLIQTKNFIMYLAVQIMCNFFCNFLLSKQADKLYPFLQNRCKVFLDKETRNTIFRNITAMIFHKIGGVCILSIENILIASFVGVYWVGLYSNYSMIIGIVVGFLHQIFSSVSASIGHLNAKETLEKSNSIFKTTFFINFWLYGFCAVAFWVLMNPFIVLWIGSQYIISKYIVLLIVSNFFITGMRKTVLIYKDTMGLFWQDRYKPIFEVTVNLIASIILATKLGLAGILLGTLTSTVTTSFWVEPYILYRYGLRRPLREYFRKYAIYAMATITAAFITDFACSMFTTNTFLSFIGRTVCCLLIPNTIFIILFYKTIEFAHVLSIIRGLVCSRLQFVYKM